MLFSLPDLNGRDGLVRTVHAGFPGKASAARYDEAARETTELIAGLLDQFRSAK